MLKLRIRFDHHPIVFLFLHIWIKLSIDFSDFLLDVFNRFLVILVERSPSHAQFQAFQSDQFVLNPSPVLVNKQHKTHHALIADLFRGFIASLKRLLVLNGFQTSGFKVINASLHFNENGPQASV